MFHVLHHRSLTVSTIALLIAFVIFGFVPEHGFRLQQQGASYLVQAGTAALIGLLMCTLTLIILLKDNRSGYPSMRCSLATLFWAFACVPVFFLTVIVIDGLLR